MSKQKQIQKQKQNQKKKEKIEQKKQEYESLLKKYRDFKNRTTLRLYEFLSVGYKMGKQIYGSKGIRYTYKKLADDFEMSDRTLKRILSLDRANKRTWRLIKEGKISANNVTYIIRQFGREGQDEIVDATIKYNLTTEDIHNYNFDDIQKLKYGKSRITIDKGYSQVSHAYRKVHNAIDQFSLVFLMDMEDFSDNKKTEMIDLLTKVNKRLTKFVKDLKENGINNN